MLSTAEISKFSSKPLPPSRSKFSRCRKVQTHARLLRYYYYRKTKSRKSFSTVFFPTLRNLNNLCLIISSRPTISIQSCPRWMNNPRNSFQLYFLHFSLLWNLDGAQRTGMSCYRMEQREFRKTNVELKRDDVSSTSTVGLKRLDSTVGAELLVLIIFLLQNFRDCLQTFNFLRFSQFYFLYEEI